MTIMLPINSFSLDKMAAKLIADNNLKFNSVKKKKKKKNQGAVSIRKTVLPGMAIPMLKIRRPIGRLIFNMEITIRR